MPPPVPLVPTAHGFPTTQSAAADFVGPVGVTFCHINFDPDFTHLTLTVPDFAVAPTFVHFEPGALLAEKALGVVELRITRHVSVDRRIFLFMQRNYARSRSQSIVCMVFQNYECKHPNSIKLIRCLICESAMPH